MKNNTVIQEAKKTEEVNNNETKDGVKQRGI